MSRINCEGSWRERRYIIQIHISFFAINIEKKMMRNSRIFCRRRPALVEDDGQVVVVPRGRRPARTHARSARAAGGGGDERWEARGVTLHCSRVTGFALPQNNRDDDGGTDSTGRAAQRSARSILGAWNRNGAVTSTRPLSESLGDIPPRKWDPARAPPRAGMREATVSATSSPRMRMTRGQRAGIRTPVARPTTLTGGTPRRTWQAPGMVGHYLNS